MHLSKKLFLLDAYALIYRAYFAFIKNPRVNSKGLDTSAIFGFTNTLIEVIKKEKPTHLAVVFDTKEPTQRHIEYPKYKAHREAMPEALRDALPYIDKLLEAFNISKLFKSGFEADDVVGTLAKQAEKEGFQVYMMTSDKDFAQLVSDNIFMYRPGNKWKPTEVWGIPEVLANFQIQKVEQVIDYLGMMGDSADNIPGIPGIGKKTAQKFIAEFGSMENLLTNTQKLKGKLKENVEQGKEIGLLSKKLVRIITDVPIVFDSDQLAMKPINDLQLTTLFNELEFRNLLSRILASNTNQKIKDEVKKPIGGQIDLFTNIIQDKNEISPVNNKIYNYTIADSIKKVEELVEKLLKMDLFGIHICTTTPDFQTSQFLGVAFCMQKEAAVYVPLIHNDKNKFLKLLEPVFKKDKLMLLGYNLKSQLKHLKHHQIDINNLFFDIGIAYYLLHPDMRQNLEVISENILGRHLTNLQTIQGKGKLKKQLEDLQMADLTQYVCEKADTCFQLHKELVKQLESSGVKKLFREIEMPLTKVLMEMELQGIQLDDTMLKNYTTELSISLDNCVKEIHLLAEYEFNIASPKQLGDVLFQKMQLVQKPKRTKSGQFSTSEETLLKIKDKHPIIEHILEYREINKLLSTYVKTLPELSYNNRIHTTFNQAVAATGRLSSINPNLQNIPVRSKKGREIRRAFVARNKNYLLLAADYSQIELRIMASLSKDDAMLEAFNTGKDIHTATAARVYNVDLDKVDRTMRLNAKSVNFGIIYGISPFGLSQNIGILRKEAKQIIDEYFQQFPKVKEYMDFVIAQAREKEYVETLFKRRRYLSDINSRNAVMRSVAERNAINAPIQGSAADIIKKAMIEIQQEIEDNELKSKMLLQVHDELVFDMLKEEEQILKKIVKEKMESAIQLEVPLVVDIGTGENWLEAH